MSRHSAGDGGTARANPAVSAMNLPFVRGANTCTWSGAAVNTTFAASSKSEACIGPSAANHQNSPSRPEQPPIGDERRIACSGTGSIPATRTSADARGAKAAERSRRQMAGGPPEPSRSRVRPASQWLIIGNPQRTRPGLMSCWARMAIQTTPVGSPPRRSVPI